MKTSHTFLLISFFTLVLTGCSSGDDSQPKETNSKPETTDQPPDPVVKPSIYESDPFTMYLLPETEEVKGVIFFLTGGSGDGRPWVRGDLSNIPEADAGRKQIEQLMQTYDLAFLGNDSSHYSDASPNQDMLVALEEFASLSEHPELADAPLLPFGYSNGGRTAINFAFSHPERTIGVYSYKGDIYFFSEQHWEIIRNVPTFLHMGELDTNEGSTIPYQYGLNREAGALWGAGIEKGAAHEFELPMDFITPWMEGLLIARIPMMQTPGTIPVLNPLTEESGWLGDLNTFEIMPFADFEGDPTMASWLYNDETSQEWQAVFQ